MVGGGALWEVGWWRVTWMDKEKSWCLSHTVFSHPRNHCCEDALHHLAILRASRQRLELVDPTAPSMSRCLSLSPSLMFLNKMPRPPFWYDLISTQIQLLRMRGWGQEVFFRCSSPKRVRAVGRTLVWNRGQVTE